MVSKMIGKTISHYKIIEKLGQGGMGVVYKALDINLDRQVAIKFLPIHLEGEENDQKRFVQEAKAVSALDHPNICTIHEIDESDDGVLFIVMACYQGETLRDKIRAISEGKSPSLSIEDLLDIAIQMAAGLAIAHENGIVHRDIKPANIMIIPTNQVKILDFGLAKLTGEIGLTRSGTTLGTVAYMSPEQLRSADVDPASDVFSLGVILYEMFAGRHPFKGEYEQALMYSITSEDPEPLSAVNSEIPPALNAIIEKALNKNKETRYGAAAELLRDLRALKRQLDTGEFTDFSHLTGVSGSGFTKRVSGAGKTFYRNRKAVSGMAVIIAVSVFILMMWFSPKFRGSLGFPTVPEVKHIAVLPFTNIGGDPQNQFLSDGLVETLTSKLSQLERLEGSLWVVPASEIRSRGISSASEAFQTFAANLVITGSVQPRPAGFRVTLNLIDARTRRQLDSKLIDESSSTFSILQDEVVIQLAEMLNVHLKPEARRILKSGNTTVPGAYEFYLQGKGFLRSYDKVENISASIELFNQALITDPDYALAHAGLGEAYLRMYTATEEVKWVEPAIEHCNKAVELNDFLAPVHVTLGMLYTTRGKYRLADREFQQALELNPNLSDAYRGRAKAFMAQGRLDDAEFTYKKSIEKKPDYWGGYNDLGVFFFRHGKYTKAIQQFEYVVKLTPQNAGGYRNLGAMYFYRDRFQDAKEMFKKAVEIKPDYSIYSNLATLNFYQGKFNEAAGMYEKALQLRDSDFRVWAYLGTSHKWSTPSNREKVVEAFTHAARLAEEKLKIKPNDPDILASLASHYVELGDFRKSSNFLKQAILLNPKQVSVIYNIGTVYEQIGQRKEALKWIKRALEKGYSLKELSRNPDLREIRKDERFKKIARKFKGKV